MENLKKEQMEAVESLGSYNKKILNAIPTITQELRGGAKPDTKEFLDHILKGMAWEFHVINGCLSYFNEGETLIDKEAVNDKVQEFNQVVESKDDRALADALENIMLPFFKELDTVIEKKKQ